MASENYEGNSYLMAVKRSAAEAVSAASPAVEAIPATQPDANAQGSCRREDRRRSPRYQCEGSVEMREEGCDVSTWATFTDISLHGCYVEAQATYPVNTVLRLKLEAKGIRVETEGKVKVNYPFLGMGIAFAHIPEEEKMRLRLLLTSIMRPSIVIGPRPVSSFSATDSLKEIARTANPEAALKALTEFFETSQSLTRHEFLKILACNQMVKTQ